MHGSEMTDRKIIVCCRETSTSGESDRIFSRGMLAMFAPSWQEVESSFNLVEKMGGAFPV